ncbi:MAG: hypothetical protein H7Z43_00450 [Clostridia bacterium]|nr:hypothetical protein [Deltaproteobacteria bacterium]
MTTLRFTWIVAVTTMLTPVVIGLAAPVRASLLTETRVAAPVELTAMADACGLQTTYGLGVVAMPAAPGMLRSADERFAWRTASVLADATVDAAIAVDAAFCPEIRAIVTSDLRSEAFAIVAWDDTSFVLRPGQTVRAPFGDVTLSRLRSRSIALVSGDVTLQCNLLVR